REREQTKKRAAKTAPESPAWGRGFASFTGAHTRDQRALLQASPVRAFDFGGSMRCVLADEHVAVYDKPRGVGSEEFVEQIAKHLGRRAVFGVHRLDAVASGLLVVGMTSQAARSLSETWDRATKAYLAICEGRTSVFGSKCN